MRIVADPERDSWPQLCVRGTRDNQEVLNEVRPIFEAVRTQGDRALRELTHRFDRADISSFQIDAEEIADAVNRISTPLRQAIQTARVNLERFHEAQIDQIRAVETMPGIRCWRRSVPIERVGLYVPGGTAPLFSTVLMLGVPSLIAGCRERIVCTPPDRSGSVSPLILATCAEVRIDRIFRVGGAQAIAAMTYGTESIPNVQKIFGPGNQYVTAAKQMASTVGVAIDLPAGPTEVAIIADDSCNIEHIAWDVLSQAEHGTDSQIVLIVTHEEVGRSIVRKASSLVTSIPRSAVAQKALANSLCVVLKNKEDAVDFSNLYGPEHLIIATRDADVLAERVSAAGSVFIGHFSPEAAGDYATGTNHTLPTNGYAHMYSGVSVDSFVKKITFQRLTREGLQNVAPAVMEMASSEELDAHRMAVEVRLK